MSNTEQMVKVPLKLTEQQARDIQRFYDTCEDGQGYDVPKDRMKSLARLGLTRSLGFGRYELTDAGDSTVNELRAQAAAQHQGEPVALPARKDPTDGWAAPGGVHKAEGWNACLDEIAKLGPLYTRSSQGEPVALAIPEECPHLIVFDDTEVASLMFSGAGARVAALKKWEAISNSWNAHLFVRVARNSRDDGNPCATAADAGEVERLRADLETMRRKNEEYCDDLIKANDQLKSADEAITFAAQQAESKQKTTDALMADAKQFRGERDILRAQLAERDALCAPLASIFQASLDEGRMPTFSKGDVRHIIKALSASAEPSTPKHETCKSCHGEGVIHTGVEESPTTLCNRCDGSGNEPSAPAERDERADFEAWVSTRKVCTHRGARLKKDSAGNYLDYRINDRWLTWQARAALERKP